MRTVALHVKFSVKPEQRPEFLKALSVRVAGTRRRSQTEQDTTLLQLVVGASIHDPNMICMYERYRNIEALEQHRACEDFLNFSKYLEDTQPLSQDSVLHEYFLDGDPAAKAIPKRPGVYCLNVEACLKPHLRDDYLTLMARHQKESQAEPLCLQFDFGQDKDGNMYIHEEYAGADEGKEGYDAHEATLHFARFMEFNKKKPYAKPQVVDFFKSIDI